MFEEDLAKKVQAGVISRTVAMEFCDSTADLSYRLDNLQTIRKPAAIATDNTTAQLLGSISLDLVLPDLQNWPELTNQKPQSDDLLIAT